MMKKLVVTFSLFLFLSALSSYTHAVTVCSSGCDKTTIKEALSDFDFNGQTVFVGPGTYAEVNLRVVDRSLVSMNNDPLTTIIDGTGITVFGNKANILNVANAMVKGFTIKGGRAGVVTSGFNSGAVDHTVLENLIIEDNSEPAGPSQGKGLLVKDGSMEIKNCIIRNNQGTLGGGIQLLTDMEVIIRGGVIEDNIAPDLNSAGLGGGIYIDSRVPSVLIENTVIQRNTAENGAGIYANTVVTLNDVKLLANIASNRGGGIYFSASNDLLDLDSTTIIKDNSAVRGGGIYITNSTSILNSFATITNNTATEGIAGSSGGGLYCFPPDIADVFAGSITGNIPGNISSRCGTIGEPTGPPPEPEVLKSSAQYPFSGTFSDRINTFTGELFFREPKELNLGGPMPLYFQRYYGSYLSRSSIVGDLGSNWLHNFDANITRSGDTITFVNQDGRSIKFTKIVGVNIWNQQNNTEILYWLTAEDGQDVTLYDPETNRVYSFDSTTGKLVKIEDVKGNVHTITYDAATGQIQTITDGNGRDLTFSYNVDATPKISMVSDGTRSINFSYHNFTDYLTSAIDENLGETKYDYEDTSGDDDNDALMNAIMQSLNNIPYTQTYYDSTSPNKGKVATQTDAEGNTQSFDYDGADTEIILDFPSKYIHTHTVDGELSNTKDAAGQNVIIETDSDGRRSSVTDRSGYKTSYNYHPGSGRLSSIMNPDGASISSMFVSRMFGDLMLYDIAGITYPDFTYDGFLYDTSGNLTEHTDRAGNITSATYNGFGQPLSILNAAGGLYINDYNADATKSTVTDPVNNTTSFDYDFLKRLKRINFDDGSLFEITRDNKGNLLTMTDENSQTMGFTYDTNDNVVGYLSPRMHTTMYSYNGNNQLLNITDPLGEIFSLTYNSRGLLDTFTDRNNFKVSLAYDLHDRVNTITDPELKIWSMSYDLDGIIESLTDPNNNTTNFTSNANGKITQTMSPMGIGIDFSYDTLGRLESVTDGIDRKAAFLYDPLGRPRGILFDNGAIATDSTRNELGNITAYIDPKGESWLRGFDNSGRNISKTDPLGNIQQTTYDNRNRPATITFPGGLGSLTLTHDLAGNLTRRDYSDGFSVSYAYNAENRLTSADGITLQYDANNKIVNSNGIAISRDAGGRITTMALAPGKEITYTYDANGRVIQINDWAGGVTTFTYDASGKLIGMQRPNGINATWVYDNDSRLTDVLEGGISTINLTRDDAGQITNAERSMSSSAGSLSSSANSFDAASQLSGAMVDYDAMGNLLSHGVNSYSWNLASQMTSMTTASGAVTATHDALGRKQSKTKNGVMHAYIWNYALGTTSISIEQHGGSDSFYYVHTPDGRLVYSVDAVSNARTYYHYDEMGNTSFLTDDNGDVIGSYAYTPYGIKLSETGNRDNLFTWQGEYGTMDEGDGLYFNTRYYDAKTARYLSRSSIQSLDPKETNPYQHASQNPMKYVNTNRRGTQIYGSIKLKELPPIEDEIIDDSEVSRISFRGGLGGWADKYTDEQLADLAGEFGGNPFIGRLSSRALAGSDFIDDSSQQIIAPHGLKRKTKLFDIGNYVNTEFIEIIDAVDNKIANAGEKEVVEATQARAINDRDLDLRILAYQIAQSLELLRQRLLFFHQIIFSEPLPGKGAVENPEDPDKVEDEPRIKSVIPELCDIVVPC